VHKGINIDPINFTTQEDSNPIEEKTYTYVGVKTIEISGVLTNKNTTINKPLHETPKVNPENAICTIKESHAMKTPYLHPNHKIIYINKSIYQHRLEHKQLTYHSKNIDVSTIEFHNNQLSLESYKQNIPQNIELG
jgi:hypothetical protein